MNKIFAYSLIWIYIIISFLSVNCLNLGGPFFKVVGIKLHNYKKFKGLFTIKLLTLIGVLFRSVEIDLQNLKEEQGPRNLYLVW